MTFKEYQKLAKETAVYPKEWPNSLYYCVMGLAGEAGEIANKAKKHWRDGVLDPHDLADELGDVLWYVAMTAYELGVDLGHVAERNVEKLQDRAGRYKIKGEGDDR